MLKSFQNRSKMPFFAPYIRSLHRFSPTTFILSTRCSERVFFPDSLEDIPKMDKNKCPKSIYEFSNLKKTVTNSDIYP